MQLRRVKSAPADLSSMRNAVTSLHETTEEKTESGRFDRQFFILPSLFRKVDVVEEISSSMNILDPSMYTYPFEDSVNKIISRHVMRKRKRDGRVSSVFLDFCLRICLSVLAHKVLPSVLEEIAHQAKQCIETVS